ncbi:MAG TPA: hypothetical protein VHY21_02955 [Pseudonocardiaceae bacterium]|nr:hypothetical protein [Pseudonocardiaceae bacterium]
MVKDSRRKSIHVMYLLGFGVLGYGVQHFLIPGKLTTVAVVAAWVFVVMIWVLLFMPTYCDYDVGGRGCTREVYGKVRGCFQHRRLKRDATWAAMGRRNPGLAFRLTWGDSRPQPGHQLGTNPGMSNKAAQQGVYNASMWAFAAVSAVVGVVTLVLAIV